MTKKKKINIGVAILIIFAIVCVSIFGTIFYYLGKDVVSVVEYKYYFKINKGGTVGFDTTTKLLHFGYIGAGEKSTRYLIISNNHEIELKTIILSYGEFSELLTPSENNFIIESGETKKINMTLNTLDQMPFGEFEGKVRVIMKKV